MASKSRRHAIEETSEPPTLTTRLVPIQVYVVANLPSGGKVELVMKPSDTLLLLYEVICLRVHTSFTLYHRLRILPKSGEETIAEYMTKKATFTVLVRVPKNNIWVGPQRIAGSYYFACSLEDAEVAFTHLFDEFDGRFRGVIEPYKDGYRYLPPKGYQALPWIALTGAMHYILARKNQSLADVLIPSEDCELIGMTLVEKHPSEGHIV